MNCTRHCKANDNYVCNKTSGDRICNDNLVGTNCSKSSSESFLDSLPVYLKITIGAGGILVVALIIFVFAR